jgi:hypothetical protein
LRKRIDILVEEITVKVSLTICQKKSDVINEILKNLEEERKKDYKILEVKEKND